MHMVSIKGEDILLPAPGEQLAKYHWLRGSVPSRLWNWRAIAGWTWKAPPSTTSTSPTCGQCSLLYRDWKERSDISLTHRSCCTPCLARGSSSSGKSPKQATATCKSKGTRCESKLRKLILQTPTISYSYTL